MYISPKNLVALSGIESNTLISSRDSMTCSILTSSNINVEFQMGLPEGSATGVSYFLLFQTNKINIRYTINLLIV